MPKPTSDEIAEITDLVESGDVILDEYRDAYRTTFGKETSLTDEQIIAFIAEHEHDDPLENHQRAKIMHAIEAEGHAHA